MGGVPPPQRPRGLWGELVITYRYLVAYTCEKTGMTVAWPVVESDSINAIIAARRDFKDSQLGPCPACKLDHVKKTAR